MLASRLSYTLSSVAARQLPSDSPIAAAASDGSVSDGDRRDSYKPVLVLGDLGGWVVGVFQRIGAVSVYWLVLALALKTFESAFIGLAWRNILLAAYPKSGLRFKTAWAASQGGTAINALTPAQAGTAG